MINSSESTGAYYWRILVRPRAIKPGLCMILRHQIRLDVLISSRYFQKFHRNGLIMKVYI